MCQQVFVNKFVSVAASCAWQQKNCTDRYAYLVCWLFFSVGKSRGKDLSSIPGMNSDEEEEETETENKSEGLFLMMFNYLIDL